VTIRPALAGRPRFEIADIVRAHRAALEAEEHLTLAQHRALSAIELCRTAALGGHLDVCRSCGHEHPAYNSCRNRHCPKCQALAQEQWIRARAERVLPVRHFHVVFTLPSELRTLARTLPRHLFAALFATASDTLRELAETHLGATLGMTMVLHTWTRDLRFHPHVHVLVTAGGLALDGRTWRPSNSSFLFPVKVMGALFKGKMMATLRALHAERVLDGLDAFRDPQAFDRWMARLAKLAWVVYAKKPFRRVDHVLAYLGRYTHRVAIANSRFVAVGPEAITFRTKEGKTVTLPPVEFLRRFVRHVLPERFKKIRHYGLYAGAASNTTEGLLAKARFALASQREARTPPAEISSSWDQQLRDLTGRDVARCPLCDGPIVRVPVPPSLSARGPPTRRAA
jgi:hypothetical protein